MSPETQRQMLEGSYLNYVWSGAEHMLTGYDHLLFLLGIIFFLTNVKDIVKFVTVFTIGHSLTLVGATLLKVVANFWVIDAVIALSVCYKGFDNNKGFQNYFGFKNAPKLLPAIFIFGLIHGFGLSTRLQELPLGDDSIEILFRILSFNLGVELGQIGGLVVMMLVLSRFRKASAFSRFSKIANDGLVLAGFILFLQQMHGYQHSVNPDEFDFARDQHYHHHVEMYEQELKRRRDLRKRHGHSHDHDHHGHNH